MTPVGGSPLFWVPSFSSLVVLAFGSYWIFRAQFVGRVGFRDLSWYLLVPSVELVVVCLYQGCVLVGVFLADPGVFQTGRVQAGKFVLFIA